MAQLTAVSSKSRRVPAVCRNNRKWPAVPCVRAENGRPWHTGKPCHVKIPLCPVTTENGRPCWQAVRCVTFKIPTHPGRIRTHPELVQVRLKFACGQ